MHRSFMEFDAPPGINVDFVDFVDDLIIITFIYHLFWFDGTCLRRN